MYRLLLMALSFSCSAKESDTSDGEATVGGVPIPSAPSDGVCPEMSESRTTTISSSGEERIVTIVTPEEITDDMPLVFFYHGLLSPDSTPSPTEYMASALNLQNLANEEGVVFVLPQSGVMERLTMEFFMWEVEERASSDITLFDDLRSCAYEQLSIDLTRVHAMGFSGGALFSTVVATERSDVLASMVQMSGGSDITMMTFDQPLSRYYPLEQRLPVLLITGGDSDEWPGGGLTLVDFSAATDTLQDSLVSDGHFVVRCEHNYGHTVPLTASAAARDWIRSHQFGEASPYEASGIEDLSNFSQWCLQVSG